MRYVIVGGLGLVGSSTANTLLKFGAPIVLMDYAAPSTTHEALLATPGVEYVNVDTRDPEKMESLLEADDRVLLSAAMVTSDFLSRPDQATHVNSVGIQNVFRAATRASCAIVVMSSSVAVYGGKMLGVIAEDYRGDLHSLTPPRLAYAGSKWLAEALGRQMHADRGPRFISLRYSTVYGPTQGPAARWSESMRRAFLGEESSDFYPRLDHLGHHDFVYSDDVAAANVLALNSSDVVGSFNIASGFMSGPAEVARAFSEVTRNDPALVPALSESELETIWRTTYPPADYRFDVSSAADQLGWAPRVDLAEGLTKSLPMWQGGAAS